MVYPQAAGFFRKWGPALYRVFAGESMFFGVPL